MAKGSRRKQRSSRSSYKRQRRYNWSDKPIEEAPVRIITMDDLPEDSKLRPPRDSDQDAATG